MSETLNDIADTRVWHVSYFFFTYSLFSDMVHDSGIGSKAYQGYLRKDRPTVAEILRDEGNYKTFMVGKWHVGGEYPPNDPEHWKVHAGDDTHPTPFQRGFQGENDMK